jgi:aromatic ring hydroxylase
MSEINNAPVLYIDKSVALPDNAQYTNRFTIHSETTDDEYIIAQHKKTRKWSCSCRGWIKNRHCKHLKELRIPAGIAYEPKIIDL